MWGASVILGEKLIRSLQFSSIEKPRVLPRGPAAAHPADLFPRGGIAMRILLKPFPVVVVLCLLGAAAVWASITGSISGIVTDQSGSIVPNAPVTATNEDTGVKSTIETDNQGFYNFPDLPV